MSNIVIPPGATKPVVASKLDTSGSVAGTGLKLIDRKVKRRLIVSVEGREKEGKSHFALTAPGPIAYLDFDIGSEGVVDKPAFASKEIHKGDYNLEFPFQQGAADRQWKQFANDYKASLGSDVLKSIIIDTGTEMYEMQRIAKFGKLSNVMPHLYGPVNAEMRELYRLAYQSDMNLIVLHKLRKQYQNDTWTGKYERAGFADTGFMVQVSVEAFKRDGNYFIKVLTCRQNPALEGREMANDFALLGVAVFPDTTEADWK